MPRSHSVSGRNGDPVSVLYIPRIHAAVQRAKQGSSVWFYSASTLEPNTLRATHATHCKRTWELCCRREYVMKSQLVNVLPDMKSSISFLARGCVTASH